MYIVVCPTEGREHKFSQIFGIFWLVIKWQGNEISISNWTITLLPGPRIISCERSFLYHFITKLRIPIIAPNFCSRPSAGHTIWQYLSSTLSHNLKGYNGGASDVENAIQFMFACTTLSHTIPCITVQRQRSHQICWAQKSHMYALGENKPNIAFPTSQTPQSCTFKICRNHPHLLHVQW